MIKIEKTPHTLGTVAVINNLNLLADNYLGHHRLTHLVEMPTKTYPIIILSLKYG